MMARKTILAALLAAGGASTALAQDANAPRLGWTLPQPAQGGSSELDRLSRSATGVSFVEGVYDAVSDNPLEPVSVTLRALDKITATFQDLEIGIGEEAAFGPLTLVPRTCDKHPPEETPETTVFLEVFASQDDVFGARSRAAREDLLPIPADPNSSIRLPGEGPSEPALAPIAGADDGSLGGAGAPLAADGDVDGASVSATPALFRGWMFASSPSLNALEHPVYDVWVIDCKMIDPRT